MRTIIFALILILVGLQYKLWIGDGSLVQWRQLEQKIDAQELENERLQVRNHAIEADIIELQSGDQALEERARHELGMVKNDEVFYQFVE